METQSSIQALRLKLTRSFHPDHYRLNKYLLKNPHSSRLCRDQLRQVSDSLPPMSRKTVLISGAGKIPLKHFGWSHHTRYATHCRSGRLIKIASWLTNQISGLPMNRCSKQTATFSNIWYLVAFGWKMAQLVHLNLLLGLFHQQTRLDRSRSVCVQQPASGASIWQNPSHPSWQ